MGWLVVAASVAGSSHEVSGTPCQDRYRCLETDAGELLIAVADGAGSADRAADGAQCAVDAAIVRLWEHAQASDGGPVAWEAALVEAFLAAKRAISDLAFFNAGSDELETFATTLTCAVATAERLCVGQVGDVVVVAEDDEGDLEVVIAPQRGEYANEVVVLTMDDALDHLVVTSVSAPPRFAVLSDGLLRLSINLAANEPHAPFFRPLLEFAASVTYAELTAREAELTSFLRSERVGARSDDDKTLVLAIRRPAEDDEAARIGA